MTDLVDFPTTGTERELLVGFLEYYRSVFARKAEGVDDAAARTATCPPSDLTITGLVRHMADVERGWFQRAIAGETVPPIYSSDADPDGDLHVGPDDSVADALAAWWGEVDRARSILDGSDLERVIERRDEAISVRWIVIHMIEEYARHCGHLDLLREAIDGQTGD